MDSRSMIRDKDADAAHHHEYDEYDVERGDEFVKEEEKVDEPTTAAATFVARRNRNLLSTGVTRPQYKDKSLPWLVRQEQTLRTEIILHHHTSLIRTTILLLQMQP